MVGTLLAQGVLAPIFAIDPFTEENGATVVIPTSHTWGDRMPADEDVIEANRHAGRLAPPVRGDAMARRRSESHERPTHVTAQYCAPSLRQENFSLSVSRARVRQRSEHVQRMLGYSIHAPFMGFVDGMHPKRLLDEA